MECKAKYLCILQKAIEKTPGWRASAVAAHPPLAPAITELGAWMQAEEKGTIKSDLCHVIKSVHTLLPYCHPSHKEGQNLQLPFQGSTLSFPRTGIISVIQGALP